MSVEITQNFLAVALVIILVWFIIKIRKRMKLQDKEKIVDDFPHAVSTFENFQHKIDYINSRLSILESKVSSIEEQIRSR